MVPESEVMERVAWAVEVGSRYSWRGMVAVTVADGEVRMVSDGGEGEGEGVRPVEAGSEGVGWVLRVRCGSASLGCQYGQKQ